MKWTDLLFSSRTFLNTFFRTDIVSKYYYEVLWFIQQKKFYMLSRKVHVKHAFNNFQLLPQRMTRRNQRKLYDWYYIDINREDFENQLV